MSRDQLDMFGTYPDRPGAVRDSDTSQAAADSLADTDLNRLRAAVFNLVAGCGDHGATCDEVEVRLMLRHQTASARIRELVLGGRLYDTGQRRHTRSMRLARVYRTR